MRFFKLVIKDRILKLNFSKVNNGVWYCLREKKIKKKDEEKVTMFRGDAIIEAQTKTIMV